MNDVELEYALSPSGQPPAAASTAVRLGGVGGETNAASESSEPLIVRAAFLLVALALLGGFWCFTNQFWVPAHGGGDQNAYLVGGRNLAEHGSIGLKRGDERAFVGRMWVKGKGGEYLPKYPLGLPVIVAGVMKEARVSGYGERAAVWAYYVSPVMMTVGLLGVFLLGRAVSGASLAGVLAMGVVASSPVTLLLANNPNSHAAALCFAVWGMFLLIRWWQEGALWRAALAGLLLGCTATVRYSEGLLALPLVMVVLFSLRRRSWLQGGVLLVTWMLPVAALLMFNRATLATWTGYDSTGESRFGEAFRWEYFRQNWQTMLRLLHEVGLFGVLPIGVMGLLMLPVVSWRLAVVLWGWVVPGVLLYTSYYWAPGEVGSVHYVRFFLTLLVPVAMGAAWALARLMPGGRELTAEAVSPRRVWGGGVAVVIVGACGAYGVWNAVPMLEEEYQRGRAVAVAAEKVMREGKVPEGSVVFGPEEFLNHLQFVGDYRLYLSEHLAEVGERALGEGRRVFAILPEAAKSEVAATGPTLGPASAPAPVAASAPVVVRRRVLGWEEGGEEEARVNWGRSAEQILPRVRWRLVELVASPDGR